MTGLDRRSRAISCSFASLAAPESSISILFPTRTRPTSCKPRCFMASAVAAPCGSSTEGFGITVTMAFTEEGFRFRGPGTSGLCPSSHQMVAASGYARRQTNDRKNLSVARIKGRFRILWHFQPREKHSFDEGVSFTVLQPVDDPAETVDDAAHSRVCRPDHGQLSFRTTKERLNHMLFRARTSEKPAVVRQCDEHLRAAKRELTSKIPQRVLETDQWPDLDRLV